MPDHVYPINAAAALQPDLAPAGSGAARESTNQESLVPLVDRQLGACRRNGGCLTVLSISVDNLATLRQRHGPAMEDKILHSVWGRLRGRLRASDIAVEADEGHFAAILLEASGSAAVVVDTRLTALLCEPYCIDDIEIALSVHTGFAVFPQAGATGEELVNAATRAKERGVRAKFDSRRA